jgi:predicted lipoprotein
MELERGSWFHLDHKGKMAKVQYSWRSKKGQLFLFADTSGLTYLFQLKRLAAYLQAGLMAPVEDETLTVRATRAAMNKIDANPDRLLTTA